MATMAEIAPHPPHAELVEELAKLGLAHTGPGLDLSSAHKKVGQRLAEASSNGSTNSPSGSENDYNPSSPQLGPGDGTDGSQSSSTFLQLDVGTKVPSSPDASSSSDGDASSESGHSSDEATAATKAQICFDFTKGMCTRADKCKFSHDIATIVNFNSKEKGICFDYLRNQCHRGLLCRFSHDLSNIAQQCQQVYNGTTPKVRTTSICYDFVKGVCQRGSECRYSHDLSLIARTARSNPAGRPSDVCYDFLRGKCSRGSACKFAHSMTFANSPSMVSSFGGMAMPPNSLNMPALSAATAQAAQAAQLSNYQAAFVAAQRQQSLQAAATAAAQMAAANVQAARSQSVPTTQGFSVGGSKQGDYEQLAAWVQQQRATSLAMQANASPEMMQQQAMESPFAAMQQRAGSSSQISMLSAAMQAAAEESMRTSMNNQDLLAANLQAQHLQQALSMPGNVPQNQMNDGMFNNAILQAAAQAQAGLPRTLSAPTPNNAPAPSPDALAALLGSLQQGPMPGPGQDLAAQHQQLLAQLNGRQHQPLDAALLQMQLSGNMSPQQLAAMQAQMAAGTSQPQAIPHMRPGMPTPAMLMQAAQNGQMPQGPLDLPDAGSISPTLLMQLQEIWNR